MVHYFIVLYWYTEKESFTHTLFLPSCLPIPLLSLPSFSLSLSILNMTSPAERSIFEFLKIVSEMKEVGLGGFDRDGWGSVTDTATLATMGHDIS